MFELLLRHFQRLPLRTRAVLSTLIYGLTAGAGAVAFQVAMNLLFRGTIEELSHHSTRTFLIGSFVVVCSTSLAAGFLMNSFCREAAGSGIPQLKLAFWKDFGVVPWRVVWVKFLGGVLSVGGGSSLGREGPSVHLAGGIASNAARWLGEAKQNRRTAAAAGAAAGLAAAFNTPLAAVTFVLEEIIADLNSRLLGSVLLASVVGAFVVHGLIGRQPAFSLQHIESPSWWVYVLTPVVAALAALAGVLFQKATLALRGRQRRIQRVPDWLKPSLGAILTWGLGATVFLTSGHLGVFGLGYDDLSSALNHQLTWQIAGVLLVTKLAATILCYGFGGCGGIFSPTLFFGGMTGVLMGGWAGLAVHLDPADQMTLAVVGMSACLGGVVRAPVTGILIVFEMTHEFSLVPALMIGAFVSQAVARRLTKCNFYEAILEQDGHNLEHVIPPRDLQTWQQLPVSAIANFQPVAVGDTSPTALRNLLDAKPYQRFPVVQDGTLAGILTRQEAEAALAANRAPKLEPAVACLPSHTIRELQFLLIESTSHIVVLLDHPGGKVLGLVTLHDLLRAEVSVANSGVE